MSAPKIISYIFVFLCAAIIVFFMLTKEPVNVSPVVSTWGNLSPTKNNNLPYQVYRDITPSATNTPVEYSPLPKFTFNTNTYAPLAEKVGETNSIKDYFSNITSGVGENIFSSLFKQNSLALKTTDNSESSPLFDYGNKAGEIIHKLDVDQKNIYVALDNFNSNPNAQNAEPLKDFAISLKETSDSLKEINNVPVLIENAHERLSSGYANVSAALTSLSEIRNKENILGAISAYNKEVVLLGKAYSNIVVLFSVNGISFSGEDYGHIFSFSGIE